MSAAVTRPVRREEIMPAAPPPRAVLMVSQKSSGLAAIMSFFWAGLGQIYTGQIAKGIVMMILYPTLIWMGFGTVVAGGLIAASSTNPSDTAAGGFALFGVLSLIVALALWVYGIVNAYRRAERLNQQQLASLQ
jgi:hypothetical protein